MTSKAKVRGTITYDDYFGHVCTCTAREVTQTGFEGESAYTMNTYERTVSADRTSGTETGSYWYSCSRCGAGAWSGL